MSPLKESDAMNLYFRVFKRLGGLGALGVPVPVTMLPQGVVHTFQSAFYNVEYIEVQYKMVTQMSLVLLIGHVHHGKKC